MLLLGRRVWGLDLFIMSHGWELSGGFAQDLGFNTIRHQIVVIIDHIYHHLGHLYLIHAFTQYQSEQVYGDKNLGIQQFNRVQIPKYKCDELTNGNNEGHLRRRERNERPEQSCTVLEYRLNNSDLDITIGCCTDTDWNIYLKSPLIYFYFESLHYIESRWLFRHIRSQLTQLT